MASEQKGPAPEPAVKPAAAQAVPKPKTPEELAQDEAKKAASSLRLIKVTSTRKERIDSPFAGWSLNEGANAFEGEIPKEVSAKYAKLVADKLIEVVILDGDGKSTPWVPPKE